MKWQSWVDGGVHKPFVLTHNDPPSIARPSHASVDFMQHPHSRSSDVCGFSRGFVRFASPFCLKSASTHIFVFSRAIAVVVVVVVDVVFIQNQYVLAFCFCDRASESRQTVNAVNVRDGTQLCAAECQSLLTFGRVATPRTPLRHPLAAGAPFPRRNAMSVARTPAV